MLGKICLAIALGSCFSLGRIIYNTGGIFYGLSYIKSNV
jgi:hypothetical protein